MHSSGFNYHSLAGDPPPAPPPRQQNLPHQTHLDPFPSSNFLNNMSSSDSNIDQFLWSRPPQDLTAVVATSSAPPPPAPPPAKQPSTNNVKIVGRNSKKRSRASRRTPTTVLTTDTANFRAMVQEFTGIPAPPFTGLLPSSSSSYLLRPFVQRLKYPSPFLSSSSSSSMSTTSSHYNQNFSNSNAQNLTNPVHNFQNFTNPFADLSDFSAKSKTLMKVGTNFFEEFGHNIASSSASHGNALQINENGQEKVHLDIMESVNGGYRDLQRRLGE